MTINVKSTQTAPENPDAAVPYRQKDEVHSARPWALAFLLGSIALYIRSLFTDEQRASAAPAEEPPAELPVKPILTSVNGGLADGMPQEPVDAEPPIGDAPEDPEFVLGSSTPPPGYRGPMQFPQGDLNINLPAYELQSPEVPLLLRPFAPANDNPNARRSTDGGEAAGGDDDREILATGDDDIDSGSGGERPPTGGEDSDPDPDDEDDTDDDDDDVVPNPDDDDVNRAPRSCGPVYLPDVFACAMLSIGPSQLLANTIDPDGDALRIVNISASSGELDLTAGGWFFDPEGLGTITLTYEITDGTYTVQQTAYVIVREGGSGQESGALTLIGSPDADELRGSSGHDNIDARAGDDLVEGFAGNDHIVAGEGADVVFAGKGDDVVFGGRGDDWIFGGAGQDRLFGDEGRDVIYGEDGNDAIWGGAGADLVFGGDGDDTIAGDEGDDRLMGDAGDDVIHGGAGNDVVLGDEGNDRLAGGAGDDLLAGGAGSDTVDGGDGDDHVVGDLDAAADDLQGGDGADTLDYSAAQARVHVDLTAGTALGDEIGQDQVAGFEEVLTGSGDDQIMAAVDVANTLIDGGAGTDTVDYSTVSTSVSFDLSEGTVTGTQIGTDTILNFETFVGGTGDDYFRAGDDGGRLAGGQGSDVFDFEHVGLSGTGQTVVYEIIDFMVGDRVRVSGRDIFKEVIDSLEDRFEDLYGDEIDEDDLPIVVSHHYEDNMRRTLIEVDLDADGAHELQISIIGDHQVTISETV